MEFLLLSLFFFLLGYLFGHRDLRTQQLLESISKLKEKLLEPIQPRPKIVIIRDKDEMAIEDQEKNEEDKPK